MAQSSTEAFIYLEATCPERNVARRYSISISRDLFGKTIVDVSWGRIGSRGQGRAVSFSLSGDATAFAHKLLNRRKGAPKRIGTAYAVIDSYGWKAALEAKSPKQSL